MDVRLSAEQVALRDSVAQLVDRHGPMSVADLDDAARRAKLDAAVSGAGWRGLRTASDDEGLPWASAVEVAIVAEELAVGLADVAYIGPVLAAELRRITDTEPAGERETVALTADLSALAEDVPAVAFDAAGASFAVIGTVGLIAAHGIADGQASIDLTRTQAHVESDVGNAALDVVFGGDIEAQWTALGLALSCADLVGVMRGTIKLATGYAGVRQQYGTLIGSFQAVQHLLADAFVAMEGSRSVALHAAWAVDALPPYEALAAAATAKAYCARAARMVCEASIQVHGGIGNTWECLAHVFLRRALVSTDLFGGVGTNLDRVLGLNGIEVAHGLR